MRDQFWTASCVAQISSVIDLDGRRLGHAPRVTNDVPFEPPASVTHVPSSVNEQAPFVTAVAPPTVSSSEPLKLQRCTSPELVAAFAPRPEAAKATVTDSIAARFNHVIIVFIFSMSFLSCPGFTASRQTRIEDIENLSFMSRERS